MSINKKKQKALLEASKAEVTTVVESSVPESPDTAKETVEVSVQSPALKRTDLNKYVKFTPNLKSGDLPLVEIGGKKFDPVGVLTFVGDLTHILNKHDLKTSSVGFSYRAVYGDIVSSVFGYHDFSSRHELEKSLRKKTYYHYTIEGVDFYLTSTCSIKAEQLNSSWGVLIADGLVASDIRVTGLGICLSSPEIYFTTMDVTDSFGFFGVAEIGIDNNGKVLKLKRYGWKEQSHNVGATSLKNSIFIGSVRGYDHISLNESIVISVSGYKNKRITVDKSAVIKSTFNTEGCFITNSKIDSCDISGKSISISNAVLRNKSFMVHNLDVNIKHALGLSEINDPLLPPVTFGTLWLDKVGICIGKYHTESDPVFNATVSTCDIIDILQNWKSGSDDNKQLTDQECRKLAGLIKSRLDTLRAINNLRENTENDDRKTRLRLPLINGSKFYYSDPW